MATVITVIFLLLAALTLFAGVMVVATKNIIHSALWLITTFFSIAALYMLLEAEFLAAVQVLLYVGAVSILVLFAIMLTRQVMVDTTQRSFYRRWWLSLGVVLLIFGGAIVPTMLTEQPNFTRATAQAALAITPQSPIATVGTLGVAYIEVYLIPFQIAGLLLLVALIGAIVIAFEEREGRKRVLTLAEEHALRRQEQAATAQAVVPAAQAVPDEGEAIEAPVVSGTTAPTESEI